ncbi:MAG: cell wall-binding repeat-containing protein [Gracilibacteraceae bacterium]|jgi:putative cell wall-binding protein|nr:cell wall-binding repeat-containing protein [Gracilibacteraceae bacterium]
MSYTKAPFRANNCRRLRSFFSRGFCCCLIPLLSLIQSLILIPILLWLLAPLLPAPLYAADASYVNPSRAEIAAKLEAVAREKEIPSVILKTLAYVESGWRQWDGAGRAVGDNPGLTRPALGIMQIASYDPADADLVWRLKYDIDFNIEYGADILNQKWLNTPTIGDNDRNVLENWYFALWAYNSWSAVNNPQTRAAAGEVPYQEAIYRRAAVEYFPGYVTPAEITRLDPELLPPGYLPGLDSKWETPEPRHYGDLDAAAPDLFSAPPDSPESPPPPPPFSMITPYDGFSAAERLAQVQWPYGSETVIIARGDDFPDALAGAPLAAYYQAPILLTDPERAPEGLISTLGVLAPSRLIILGGESAVSQAVETELQAAMPWLKETVRLAGANRYETAARIASFLPAGEEAALATGLDYPDALTIAAAAAARGAPRLLTRPDGLPPATESALRERAPRRLLIAGGEGAVGPAVLADVAALGLAAAVDRYAGANRYETSAAVAAEFYPDGGVICLAEGGDYADALPAAAAAAARGGCLLLIDGEGIAGSSAAARYLSEVKAIDELVFVSADGNEELWARVLELTEGE